MTAFITAVISGALLAFFALLLNIEEKRGERIMLRRARAALDRTVERGGARLHATTAHLGEGTFRLTFHYFIHGILGKLLVLSERAGEYLKRLRERNRRIVKKVEARDAESGTHLDLIARDREENALSPAAKRKLKEHSLNGK